VGGWLTFPGNEADEIKALLTEGKPPHAARDEILDLLPGWSERSGDTIGMQANSIVISAGRESPEWAYHSQHNTHVTHLGTTVMSKPEGSYVFADVQVHADDSETTAPMVVPRPQGGRRRPCPCGSGKQYRLCHGRHE
jgi:hypothetical protein